MSESEFKRDVNNLENHVDASWGTCLELKWRYDYFSSAGSWQGSTPQFLYLENPRENISHEIHRHCMGTKIRKNVLTENIPMARNWILKVMAMKEYNNTPVYLSLL